MGFFKKLTLKKVLRATPAVTIVKKTAKISPVAFIAKEAKNQGIKIENIAKGALGLAVPKNIHSVNAGLGLVVRR